MSKNIKWAIGLGVAFIGIVFVMSLLKLQHPNPTVAPLTKEELASLMEKPVKNPVMQKTAEDLIEITLTDEGLKNFDKYFPAYKDIKKSFDKERNTVNLFLTEKQKEDFRYHKQVTGMKQIILVGPS